MIPEEAVQAAVDAELARLFAPGYLPHPRTLVVIREVAVTALTAAAPHIAVVTEAAMREQVAVEIEALPDVYIPGYFGTRPGGYVTRTRAASIARGVT